MAVEQHRYAIVGAGLAGAAAAWHVRRRGVTDVVVLEKEAVPGFHSSGRNAAMLRETMEEPELQDMATRSAVEIRKAELARFDTYGSLLMGMGEDEASRWIPGASGRGRFCPDDGVVDVAALLTGFLRGTDVRYECELRAHTFEADGVVLETATGVLRTDVLVNAAGAWAGQIGDLPIRPTNRTIFVSAPDDAIEPSWPFLWAF